jgi:hypothetical protein
MTNNASAFTFSICSQYIKHPFCTQVAKIMVRVDVKIGNGEARMWREEERGGGRGEEAPPRCTLQGTMLTIVTMC